MLELPQSFKNVVVSDNNDSNKIVRSNLYDLADCKRWLGEFSKQSKTCWISNKSKMDGERYARVTSVFHLYIICCIVHTVYSAEYRAS